MPSDKTEASAAPVSRAQAALGAVRPALYLVPSVLLAAAVATVAYAHQPLVFDESLIPRSAAAASIDELAQIDTSEVERSSDGGSGTYSGSSDDFGFSIPEGGLADGTFYGSGEGYKSTITVAVTVMGGKILSASIVSEADDAPYMALARGVLSRVVSAQSTSVDTVSGATYSSKGILAAVKSALQQSATQRSGVPAVSVEADAEDEKPSAPATTEPTAEGPFLDGLYTASAYCSNTEEPDEWEPYYLQVTVMIEGGKPVAITDVKGSSTAADQASPLGEYDESNDTYLGWAAFGRKASAGIVAQLTEQGKAPAEVDVVTRATYSSRALVSAYQKALLMASQAYIEAQGGTAVQPSGDTGAPGAADRPSGGAGASKGAETGAAGSVAGSGAAEASESRAQDEDAAPPSEASSLEQLKAALERIRK